MTTLTLDRTLVFDLDLAAVQDAADAAPGAGSGEQAPPIGATRDRPTLDELIVGVWEGLDARHTATCPVCSGAMTARFGSGHRPVGGRCGDCGSALV